MTGDSMGAFELGKWEDLAAGSGRRLKREERSAGPELMRNPSIGAAEP